MATDTNQWPLSFWQAVKKTHMPIALSIAKVPRQTRPNLYWIAYRFSSRSRLHGHSDAFEIFIRMTSLQNGVFSN